MNKTIPSLYYRISRRSGTLIIVCNALGALLLFVFLSSIDPLPADPQFAVQGIAPISIAVFACTTALLLWAGGKIPQRIEKRMQTWFSQDCDPASPLIPQIQRDMLNRPLVSSGISMLMWIFAGVIFSYLSYGMEGLWYGFIVVTCIGGVLVSVMVYFVEELSWRAMLPPVFSQGQLSTTRAFHMPLGRRLMVVFTLITLYPAVMLALLSLSRARAMLTSPNPGIILSNLEITLLFIVVVSALVSIGMALFVTRSISEPVRMLKEKMAQVEKQNFDATVPVTTNDELGYLAEGFNQMVSGLKRGEAMRNLLNLYVSPEVARQALESGAQLGGQLVQCSVLFSDIRDFTGLSERLEPQALIDLLNRYMSAMVTAIVQHGGMVNKFGGDSLLAVFGTPINPTPDHAARAIQAGLEMQRALSAFNLEQAQAGGAQLRIGIGVASGPAVAGNVGGKERLEYTVIGDTVNLASRLQSLTKEMGHEFLANQEACQQARATLPFEAQAIPGIQIRGKSAPLTVYAIKI
ncbi:MAG TPA: adenylate/guanylate cyclase domain-containing protein [Anaerolineaceae bacterium]|nr:adenylate/guanylate cyclase domain-containing protein [Anaerolineaceae bacterium]